MPENLSSIMGGNFSPAPAKKKLKKVGGHWEDEQGNQFADAEGTQPIQSETSQAKAGVEPTSAMDAFGVEKATGTGGWAVGPKSPSSVMASGVEENRTPLEIPEGMTSEQKAQADSVWEQYSHAVGPQNLWYKKWMKMSEKERRKWLDRVANRPV